MRTLAALLTLTVLAGCNTPTRAAPSPAPAPSSAPAPSPPADASAPRAETIATAAGPLVVTPLHHASLLLQFAGKTIAVDPTADGNRAAPGPFKADYVFVTDIHPDHLDPLALGVVLAPGGTTIGPPAVAAERPMSVVLKNGETHDFGAFKVEAVPMYNVVRGPGPGKLFHDKGRGDGYVFTFGDVRVYVSGDTECTPEMKALPAIQVAFLCMNLPYTMPPDEAATCARAFKPKIVYPYHFRGQDPRAFAAAVEGSGIDVRIRDWY